MRQLITLIALGFVFTIVSLPSFAEDKAENPLKPVMEEGVRKATENGKDLSEMLNELSGPLENKNRYHLSMIYTNHNLIATVKEVRKNVLEATKACGENNPDIEEALETRFKLWSEAIDPKIEEAEGQVKNMIISQDYVEEKKIEELLETADKVRTYTQNIYKKVPVKSKEACAYLLNKMDETQDDMSSLLNSTLVSVPQEMMKLPPENDENEPDKADETEDL